MIKTDYEIRKCGKNIMVWKNSKMVTQGFFDIESALHSVWVIEGKKPSDFYIEKDNDIFLTKMKKEQ